MNNHKIDSDNTTIDYREGANDHFAAIIMLLLASHNELVLTGGFAIKTLYASKRPTKDLDYRARVNNPDAACIVEGVLSDLDHFGVDCVMVDKNSNQYRDRLFLQYTFPTIRYSSVLQIDIAKYYALHLETWSRTVTSIYDYMVNFQVAFLATVYQLA